MSVSARIKIPDIIILAAIILLAIAIEIHGTYKKGNLVKVNANGTEYVFSAKKDGIHVVKGALGNTVFEIKNGRIRILESPCPNKTCIHQGWSNILVCLPNKVLISTDNKEEEFDAIAK